MGGIDFLPGSEKSMRILSYFGHIEACRVRPHGGKPRADAPRPGLPQFPGTTLWKSSGRRAQALVILGPALDCPRMRQPQWPHPQDQGAASSSSSPATRGLPRPLVRS